MENLISKELLSNIFGFKIRKINQSILDGNLYYYKEFYKCKSKINIYALAHKCKEWAIKQSNKENKITYIEITQIYTIFYKSKDKVSCYIHYFYEDKKSGAGKEFIADTESEAIFEACEWIRKELLK